jgi:uncharacterized protein
MTNLDELFPPRGNLPWLRERTILLTRHGSHAYGLNTPTSDRDYKGVAVPPREYFLGFASVFEQAESGEPDLVIYELRKFFRLARDCNPNIIEVLFTDPSDHLVKTAAAERLLAGRDLFLSRKAKHTFSGYAIAQLKRLSAHQRWLRDPPAGPPRREDFGLRPEATGSGSTGADEQATASGTGEASEARAAGETGASEARAAGEVSASEASGLSDAEREYRARKQEWAAYQNWLSTRNKARAELEARFGYDVKHGMHVVRLLRMCREILAEGRVVVRRPDRDDLLAVRSGAWPYDRLVAWATEQDAAMSELYERSPLPRTPDTKALDALCISIAEMLLGPG